MLAVNPKQRRIRIMKHYYHYRPENTGQSSVGRSERADNTSARRSFWRNAFKRLLPVIGILLLAFVIVLPGMYLYITRTALDNTDDRTNILILGVDEIAQLSDTILIASIRDNDEDSAEVALVSIPRDLYVDVPEFGGNKINAAYALGENNDYPGGGAGLTADTIENQFDTPIHYYAALDFEGFEQMINSVGGVTIDVETAIDDPHYPAPNYDGYDPFSIEAGTHHMDGETALKYVRSRKTTNDFDRAYRQQQVLLALRDRVFESGILPLNIPRVFNLVRVTETQLDSDMHRLEMLKLTYTLRNAETETIPRYVIDTSNLLTSSPSHGALVPRDGDFQEVQQFLEEVFTQQSVKEFKRQF